MSAYDDDADSIRHEWDEDPDEEEIVADAQRRAARGARILTADEVRALLAEGREGAAEMERKRRRVAALSAVEMALAHAVGSGIDTAEILAEEVHRLRALPVIRTCGDCGWNAADLVTDRCVHDDRDTGDDAINVREPPPSWCPLRGAR